MKFSVSSFPGSNSDYDAAHAPARMGEQADLISQRHRRRCGRRDFAGRFAHGDYLRRAIAPLATPERRPAFADRGGPFSESEWFQCCSKPGCCRARGFATKHQVRVAVGPSGRAKTPVHVAAAFEAGVNMPIAHARTITTRPRRARGAQNNRQVIFRYVDGLERCPRQTQLVAHRIAASAIASALVGLMPHPGSPASDRCARRRPVVLARMNSFKVSRPQGLRDLATALLTTLRSRRPHQAVRY